MKRSILISLVILALVALTAAVSYLLLRDTSAQPGAAVPGTSDGATPSALPRAGSKEQIPWIDSAPVLTIAEVLADPAAYDDQEVILSSTAYYYAQEAYLSDETGARVAFAGFPDASARASSDALQYFQGSNATTGVAAVYALGTMLTTGGPYSTGVATTSRAIILKDLRLR